MESTLYVFRFWVVFIEKMNASKPSDNIPSKENKLFSGGVFLSCEGKVLLI